MINNIFLTIILLGAYFTLGHAQNETMYILKNGQIIDRYNVSSEMDSITFNEPIHYNLDEILSNESYSIYLELFKRSGYYSMRFASEYQLAYFVPDNTAFETYFDKYGISGVEALSDEEVLRLFTLHYYSRGYGDPSRFYLIYEYVWGEQQRPGSEYESLFFRKLTASVDASYTEVPRYHDVLQDEISIYTTNKYIPLWSIDYFEDISSPTDGSDYEYLYPNSDFDSESELSHLALNLGNAKVLPNPNNPKELGMKTSSGYVYLIDQVVEPLPTLEVYLKNNQDKYGLFYDLLQRFANYGNPMYNTIEREIQYKKTYSHEIPSIADENGPSTNTEYRKSDYFTAFIPQDDVLQTYLDHAFLSTFTSIDSIPDVTLSYLLRAHLNNYLGLVSKMEKGFFDSFGTLTFLNQDLLNGGIMCSNGAFYETKIVMEPYAFTTITSELFFNKDYSTFLFMLEGNGLLSNLISKGDQATIFAPTNNELLAANIKYNADNQKIYYKGVDNVWRNMLTNQLIEFIQNHISYEKIEDLSGEGFLKMASGNFVYYSNGVLEGPENQFLGENCPTQKLKENETGVLYHTNVPIKSRYYTLGKLLHNSTDENYAETLTDTTLTEFSIILENSRILNRRLKDPVTRELIPKITIISAAEEWTVFAPTNEAIRKARVEGLIPTERDSLRNWIFYHFVPNHAVFDDGDEEGTGTFNTFLEVEDEFGVTTFETIKINNSKFNMQITDNSGQVISVEHSNANMLAQKGVVHKINSVLKVK